MELTRAFLRWMIWAFCWFIVTVFTSSSFFGHFASILLPFPNAAAAAAAATMVIRSVELGVISVLFEGEEKAEQRDDAEWNPEESSNDGEQLEAREELTRAAGVCFSVLSLPDLPSARSCKTPAPDLVPLSAASRCFCSVPVLSGCWRINLLYAKFLMGLSALLYSFILNPPFSACLRAPVNDLHLNTFFHFPFAHFFNDSRLPKLTPLLIRAIASSISSFKLAWGSEMAARISWLWIFTVIKEFEKREGHPEELQFGHFMFGWMVVFPFGNALAVAFPCLCSSFAPWPGTVELLGAHAAPRLDTFGRHNMMDVVAIALEDQLLVACDKTIGTFAEAKSPLPLKEVTVRGWAGS